MFKRDKNLNVNQPTLVHIRFFYSITHKPGFTLEDQKVIQLKKYSDRMPTYLDNYNLVGATRADCMQDVSLGPDYLSLLK